MLLASASLMTGCNLHFWVCGRVAEVINGRLQLGGPCRPTRLGCLQLVHDSVVA